MSLRRVGVGFSSRLRPLPVTWPSLLLLMLSRPSRPSSWCVLRHLFRWFQPSPRLLPWPSSSARARWFSSSVSAPPALPTPSRSHLSRVRLVYNVCLHRLCGGILSSLSCIRLRWMACLRRVLSSSFPQLLPSVCPTPTGTFALRLWMRLICLPPCAATSRPLPTPVDTLPLTTSLLQVLRRLSRHPHRRPGSMRLIQAASLTSCPSISSGVYPPLAVISVMSFFGPFLRAASLVLSTVIRSSWTQVPPSVLHRTAVTSSLTLSAVWKSRISPARTRLPGVVWSSGRSWIVMAFPVPFKSRPFMYPTPMSASSVLSAFSSRSVVRVV
mmetsp:Transcript_30431/g.69427  ORF Transcript_30431/g.69427 Transcript_30431/m.69427 type:complete len:327 (-) Transcript_30431:3960-4940(-)